jgi:lipoprotein-releasing system permease protein
MYKLFIAFRYLRAHRILYFSIAGVAFGLMTLVVVTSVMGGFSRDLRARIRGMQSHLVVVPTQKSNWLADYDALAAELRKVPHVVGASPRIEWEAWLGRGGSFRDVHLVGIVPEHEKTVSDLDVYFRKGSMKDGLGFPARGAGDPGLPPAVLGSELREGVRFGLLTARYAGGPMLLVKDLENVGYFRSGMAEYDANYVFMELKTAQDLLQVAGSAISRPMANAIAIKVDDYDENGRETRDAVVEALHRFNPCDHPGDHRPSWYGARCGLYRVLTWEQTRTTLLAAVDVEKAIMIIVLFMIVIVAGFNIISINTLVVKAKTRDIGILRALGATEGGIIAIFLTAGVLCGLFGSIFGIGLGLLLSYNINEIADLIRIVSRDLNRLSLEPDYWANVFPRGGSWLAALALLAAGSAVIANWFVLYQERLRHPWVRMGVAAALIWLAAWLATAWMPGYLALEDYDPKISEGLRAGLVSGFVGFWILLVAAWRGLDRFRSRPPWVFFGAAATILFSALLLVVVSVLAIAVAIGVLQPASGWAGLELFPRKIYYLDRIPVFVDYTALGVIVVLTLLISLIFSVYPALRASKSDPIEAIRDE